MITGKLKQINQGLKVNYVVEDAQGKVVGRAEHEGIGLYGTMNYLGEYHIQLNGVINDTLRNMGKPEKDRSYRKATISKAKKPCGSIELKQVRTGLFSRNNYHEVSLLGRVYRVYTIGKGKQGMVYAFYLVNGDTETQVARVEKPAVVIDMKDEYQYYINEEFNCFDAVMIYLLYHDYTCHGEHGAVSVRSSKEITYLTTTNKFLLSKCNTDFKDSI